MNLRRAPVRQRDGEADRDYEVADRCVAEDDGHARGRDARALGVAIPAVGPAMPPLLESAGCSVRSPLSILQVLKIAGAGEEHVSESRRWRFL